MDKPTPQQALDLVAQACAAFAGTLQQHQMLQAALGVLAGLVNPKKEE